MPSGDSKCKYCGDPIRWVDHNGHRLALDVASVLSGGSYRVVGAETASYINRDDRAKFGKLYRPHKCQQWKDAKAIIDRERTDRDAERSRPTLPPNVVPYRNPSIVIPPRRRR